MNVTQRRGLLLSKDGVQCEERKKTYKKKMRKRDKHTQKMGVQVSRLKRRSLFRKRRRIGHSGKTPGCPGRR